MLYQLLFLLFGTLSIISAIRFCLDFSACKNPMLHGIKRKAEIVDFCTDCTWRAIEEFAVIEYLEEEQILRSKVERAKDDMVGDRVIVLSTTDNFTVRCGLYIPFDMQYKVSCFMLSFILFILHWIVMERINEGMWILLIFLGVCYFLYHPFWLYHTFYGK